MPAGAQRARTVGKAGARRRALCCCLALIVVVATGCSGDENRADDGEDGSSTTSAETSETTSVARNAEEQEVIDAYLAAGEAFDEAAMVPDPDYPLEETHTGPMLEQARRVLQGLAADGLVVEYPDGSRLEVVVTSVQIEGDRAVLEACGVDDGRRVNQETREIVAGGGTSSVWSTAGMRRIGGVWKLSERREDRREDGVAECSSTPQ